MLEPSLDLERRRPVWEALSDLFLDTELQDYHFVYIARRISESKYTDDETRLVLLREVFPACIPNMHHPAGVWDGFSLEWLEEKILQSSSTSEISESNLPSDWWMIEKEWNRVLNILPEARCLHGNAQKLVALDPSWQSSTVLDLARTIYDQRTFEIMPILGDALMDAGCDSDVIIQHCQGPGPHVRGCWVVDLLLGKE